MSPAAPGPPAAGGWLRRPVEQHPGLAGQPGISSGPADAAGPLIRPRDEANNIRLNARSATIAAGWAGRDRESGGCGPVRSAGPGGTDLQDRKTREAVLRADQEARELRMVDDRSGSAGTGDVKAAIGKPGAPVAVRPRPSGPARTLEDRRRHDADRGRRGPRPALAVRPATSRRLLAIGRRHAQQFRRHLAGSAALPRRRPDPSDRTAQGHVAKGSAGWSHQAGRGSADRLRGNSGMYAHGQGAIVLSEAFLMTGDEELRQPAQKAIDFIVAAQYPRRRLALPAGQGPAAASSAAIPAWSAGN